MTEEPKVEIVSSESGQEIKLLAEIAESLKEEVTPEEPFGETTVVASNPQQMQAAQATLIGHFKKKVAKLEEEAKGAEENVKTARARKWKVSPFEAILTKTVQDLQFYQKIVAALEAGFVIIPNFDELDIFAIRTTRKRPKANRAEGGENWVNVPKEQVSNRPALGDGRYVNADTRNKTWTTEKRGNDNSIIRRKVSQAVAFDDIDFPFHMVKPEVLERTAEAMKLLAFDDVGILPNRKIRRGDPMVVGRIFTKRGASVKAVSFLITWFVNTEDI